MPSQPRKLSGHRLVGLLFVAGFVRHADADRNSTGALPAGHVDAQVQEMPSRNGQ